MTSIGTGISADEGLLLFGCPFMGDFDRPTLMGRLLLSARNRAVVDGVRVNAVAPGNTQPAARAPQPLRHEATVAQRKPNFLFVFETLNPTQTLNHP